MCVNLCVYVVFAAFIGEIKIYIGYDTNTIPKYAVLKVNHDCLI